MINITAALLAHHTMLLIDSLLSIDDRINVLRYLPVVLQALYVVCFGYFATVVMLLFAAEAVNLFVRIVWVFSEIDHYVMKATIIAWSKGDDINFIHFNFFYSYPIVFEWILVQFLVLTSF